MAGEPGGQAIEHRQGLEVAAPRLHEYIVPTTLAVLTGLFVMQRHGTGQVGKLFGPVMAIWFGVLALLGFQHVVDQPGILRALSPHYAIVFMLSHPSIAFVALGSVPDPTQVVPAIARAVGLRETSARPLGEALVDELRGQRLLLLLDGFEHLLPAAPRVVELLGACAGLRALVTSRAALRVWMMSGLPVSRAARMWVRKRSRCHSGASFCQ